MVVVFVNGSLFDGHRYAGPGAAVVEDDRLTRRSTSAPDAGSDGPGPGRDRAPAWSTWRAACSAPGFVDAHVHPSRAGWSGCAATCPSWTPATTTSPRSRSTPRPTPTLPGSWAAAGRCRPSRAAPRRPPTSTAWSRTGRCSCPTATTTAPGSTARALELAGLDAHTPDPPDGRIERDDAGRPSGTLHEGATSLVSRHLPRTTGEDYYAALLAGQAYLHSLGVTGWQDAIVGAYSGMDDPGSTYTKAAANGDLRSDVVGALWWERRLGAEQVADLVGRRAEMPGERFRATSVKVMQDGVAENGTAAMSAPYLDRCGHPTDNSGHSFVDPDALRDAVAALDAAGFQVHVHAIGDRAAREALDAFEGTDPARRHHIAHLQLVDPDDVPRFAGLGVAANLQALWACYDDQMVDLTIPFLGEERAGWQYPFGDLHRAGARLVAGSDWPVSTPDPLAAIHVAVNRTAYGESGKAGHEPFLPDQALALETAFAAYTSGRAWVNHRDDAGVLREGAVADLVVLDRDPFAGPLDEIGATRVVSTWVDGAPVFEA